MHKGRFSQHLGCRWSLTMNMEYLERSVPPLMQDVHVHVAESRTGAAGFVRMDGRARFKDGCRNDVL